MEYVYAAMLLHAAKKEITEKSVSEVLQAAGVKAEAGQVKALIAALKDVNIDEAIKNASMMQAAPAAAPAAAGAAPKAEKKEEDTAKSEEAAAEGLSALFG
ncbi:MAG: 50S ribosomal protein P1 [Candidatus Micrarchaeota archaeon]